MKYRYDTITRTSFKPGDLTKISGENGVYMIIATNVIEQADYETSIKAYVLMHGWISTVWLKKFDLEESAR